VSAITRIPDRVTSWYERTVAAARARSELVDHGFRVKERYEEVRIGRLAAAIAYYAFFATFALAVVGYAILGFLVERNLDFQSTVNEFLEENLPFLSTGQISSGRGAAGLFGLAALALTGIAWVDALRSSQRLIWDKEQGPGNPFLRRGIDIVVLLVLALLLAASFAVAGGIEYLIAGVPVLRHFGWVLMIGVNLVLALALLAGLPWLRMPRRVVLPPAAGLAVGIFLLNELGGIYIDRIRENPAYTVVATGAGALVYLYLFHQLVLIAAAWAATDARVDRLPREGGRDDGHDA
jgi:membrane protein